MRRQDILRFADSRYGLITRSDVLAAGGSASTWRRACDDGIVREVFAGVAQVAGASLTPFARIAAAVAVMGDDAQASHLAGTSLWVDGLPVGDRIDVLVTRDATSTRSIPGIVVHRPRDRQDLKPYLRHGIRVCSPTRCLVDLAGDTPEYLHQALTAMRVAGRVTPEALVAAVHRHSRPGRPGPPALRAALERQALDVAPPDSVLEEAMARIARSYRLPPLEFHAVLEGYEVDFWVVDTPLYLECDGWATHGVNRDQFEYDRQRDAILVAAGFVPVRVTWTQITRTPAVVAARIVAAHRRWSAAS